jgi:predicted glycogen debranching enzyme
LNADRAKVDLIHALEEAASKDTYPRVVTWTLIDHQRITPVPPGHWVLIEDNARFRAILSFADSQLPLHCESIGAGEKQIVALAPRLESTEGILALERYDEEPRRVNARLRFLSSVPRLDFTGANWTGNPPESAPLVLLTNGLGGMGRLCVDLGAIKSKYDCLLGANLHSSVPVDRHVLAKRARVWLVANGFVTPLNQQSLLEFSPGPPARWRFVASAGGGCSVMVDLVADMLHERNSTLLRFARPAQAPPFGVDLPSDADVRLTVRVDIEDRNFHTETHRNAGAEHHFRSHCHTLQEKIGFSFTPASDRELRVVSDAGQYHPEPEWSDSIPHVVEATRGLTARGGAYSPGWFDLPLAKGVTVTLTLCADAVDPQPELLSGFVELREGANASAVKRAKLDANDSFGQQLARAIQAFVVRREKATTVIAGYPWFLDWGRDSLICARGLLAAGLIDEVRALLVLFGRFADKGTLPNIILGEDASNRETSDAPLWYGIVCEDLAAIAGENIYQTVVDHKGRSIADVLQEIALGYRDGTPNGIRMDTASALIWSPPHFTWMDTNHPAGTPREGYPIEIQVLWIRLLRQLERLSPRSEGESWRRLADRAHESLNRFFWLEAEGHFADLLVAKANQPASEAKVDDALRSNFLFAISLGLVADERAQRAVSTAARHLVVPGALRSLAPLKVSLPLPIYGNDGRLLNNPVEPYCGRYEGDEDTRRKPAYHNGTAWVWTLPTFSEAVVRAWRLDPEAIAAARAYLGSMDCLMNEGCLGQLPEILDGDAPHTQRGCDAQAWSVTEALRVWKFLHSLSKS